jgi:hypothetical protein
MRFYQVVERVVAIRPKLEIADPEPDVEIRFRNVVSADKDDGAEDER